MAQMALDDFASRFEGWSADELLDPGRVLSAFLEFARAPSLDDGSFVGDDQISASVSVWDAETVKLFPGMEPVPVPGEVALALSRDVPVRTDDGEYEGRYGAGVSMRVAAEHAGVLPRDLDVRADLEAARDGTSEPGAYEPGSYLRSVDDFERVLRGLVPGLFEIRLVACDIEELQEVD